MRRANSLRPSIFKKGPHEKGRLFGLSHGNGGKNLVMLDNALAMVDNVVAMKLGL